MDYFDKNYMDRCSEKTLQSNPKGFFMSFVDHITEIAGEEWITKVFGKVKTDAERIRLIFSDSKVSGDVCQVLINVQELFRAKDEAIAERLRNEAEKEIKQSNFSKATLLYSQSVLRAPSPSVTLALSLYGRATSFISTNDYVSALADIQLSLKNGLPDRLKSSAYWKMAICHTACSQNDKAAIAFGLAEKTLNDPEDVARMKEDRMKEFRQGESGRGKRAVLPDVEEKLSRKIWGNAKLKLNWDEFSGRHFVAKDAISTGELLVVEQPYAACLLPDCFGTHCHHCFERLVAPIGCPTCSNVAFCSPNCQTEAVGSYHKYECKFINLLIGSGMSILAHTALRIVTQKDLNTNLKIFENKNEEKVYQLCTNADKRKPKDFLQRTLMAAFLLRCLQKSGYFDSEDVKRKTSQDIVPTQHEYKIGEIILFHLQMLQFNAHEIYETRHGKHHRFKEAKAAYIAVGVYPTVALFNHDCYPAVTRYFVGKNIIINAARPLATGEIVAENYGPIFTRKNLKERQTTLLARYWFNCKCRACTENWPSLDNGLETVSRRFKCSSQDCDYLFTTISKISKCPGCKKKVSFEDSLKLLEECEVSYKSAFDAMEAEDPEKAINVLCPAIDTFHRICCPPHKETHLAQEILRACLADFGNSYQCLTTTEKP